MEVGGGGGEAGGVHGLRRIRLLYLPCRGLGERAITILFLL